MKFKHMRQFVSDKTAMYVKEEEIGAIVPCVGKALEIFLSVKKPFQGCDDLVGLS